ncbi:MAG: hypothetical protein NT099_03545 [Candidatus Saganbacteria bacterium]|nr:hypothetical protein [Candidatus Saganbacteria bacterium]
MSLLGSVRNKVLDFVVERPYLREVGVCGRTLQKLSFGRFTPGLSREVYAIVKAAKASNRPIKVIVRPDGFYQAGAKLGGNIEIAEKFRDQEIQTIRQSNLDYDELMERIHMPRFAFDHLAARIHHSFDFEEQLAIHDAASEVYALFGVPHKTIPIIRPVTVTNLLRAPSAIFLTASFGFYMGLKILGLGDLSFFSSLVAYTALAATAHTLMGAFSTLQGTYRQVKSTSLWQLRVWFSPNWRTQIAIFGKPSIPDLRETVSHETVHLLHALGHIQDDRVANAVSLFGELERQEKEGNPIKVENGHFWRGYHLCLKPDRRARNFLRRLDAEGDTWLAGISKREDPVYDFGDIVAGMAWKLKEKYRDSSRAWDFIKAIANGNTVESALRIVRTSMQPQCSADKHD